MFGVETNVLTGEVKQIVLTPAEEAAALARQAALDADNTQDKRARRAIDGMDRIQFELIFGLTNDVRELRATINILRPGSFTVGQASQIRADQFTDALIARWKALNA
jgi:hypothetical protein